MNTLRLALFAAAIAAAPSTLAQSTYVIAKSQRFAQTVAAGAVPNPNETFVFQASAMSSANLLLPNGATLALPGSGNSYHFEQSFTAKAAFDTAFPNGLYRITGPGLPALSLSLATDGYPSTTPGIVAVSNGTWRNGVLVVDPTQPVTFELAPFTGYGPDRLAHINVGVAGMFDRVNYGVNYISMGAGPGMTLRPTPITSFTVPAGTMTSGRAYLFVLDYAYILEPVSIGNVAAASMFTNTLHVYLGAQAPGAAAPAPVLVTQPISRAAPVGGTVTFSATATVGGSSQFTDVAIVWRLNGRHIDTSIAGGKYAGSAGATLTIRDITPADAGAYTVTLLNAGGMITSEPATLSIAAAPVIAVEPRSVVVAAGSTAALTVNAAGNPAPAYQWKKDGVAIPDATSDLLLLHDVSAADRGSYTVTVTNPFGTVSSAPATLDARDESPGRLANLSVLATLDANRVMIVGFATEGEKHMLVRGIGPSLSRFGVAGAQDPAIELFNAAGGKVDENNDWEAGLAPAFAACGAFPLVTGSRDAALQRFCTGAHTAQVRSAARGLVLVEIYDSGGAGRLMNVSARNLVDSADNLLIAGFVIEGAVAKTLLIRAVGAKLADFGLAGVLADPKLAVCDAADVTVAVNDEWNPLLQPVARAVGAFDLTPGNRDAALLVTLPPGNYSARVSGIGPAAGEALVEVYDVR